VSNQAKFVGFPEEENGPDAYWLGKRSGSIFPQPHSLYDYGGLLVETGVRPNEFCNLVVQHVHLELINPAS